MPFNGSGTFVPLAAPTFPAVAGAVIRSAHYNDQLNDVFAGLSNCLTRDGQAGMQADLDMGGFTITGVQAANADGEALIWQQAEVLKGDLEDTYPSGVDWNTLVAAGVWRIRTVACFAPPFLNFPVFPNTSTPAALGMLRVITGIADSTPTYCLQHYENGTGDIFIRFGTFSGTWTFTSWLACGLTAFSDSAHLTLGDALIAFRQSDASGALANTVGSTVHKKLQDLVTVRDFGADETGATDCTAAVVAAYAIGGVVKFTKGTFKFGAGAASVPSGVQGIKGAGYKHTTLKPVTNIATFLAHLTSDFSLEDLTVDVHDWVVATGVLIQGSNPAVRNCKLVGATTDNLSISTGAFNSKVTDNIFDMSYYPASNGVKFTDAMGFEEARNDYRYSLTHTGAGVVVNSCSDWSVDSTFQIQAADQIPLKLEASAKFGNAKVFIPGSLRPAPSIANSSTVRGNTIEYVLNAYGSVAPYPQTGIGLGCAVDGAGPNGVDNKLTWRSDVVNPARVLYSPRCWMSRGEYTLQAPVFDPAQWVSGGVITYPNFRGLPAADEPFDLGFEWDSGAHAASADVFFPLPDAPASSWVTVLCKYAIAGDGVVGIYGAEGLTVNSTAGEFFQRQHVGTTGDRWVRVWVRMPATTTDPGIVFRSTQSGANANIAIHQLWVFEGIVDLAASDKLLDPLQRCVYRFDGTVANLAAATQAAGIWTVASTVIQGPQLRAFQGCSPNAVVGAGAASTKHFHAVAGLVWHDYTVVHGQIPRLDPFLDTTVNPPRLCCRVTNMAAGVLTGGGCTIAVHIGDNRDIYTLYQGVGAGAPVPVPAGTYVDVNFPAPTNAVVGTALYTSGASSDLVRQGVIAEVFCPGAGQYTFRYWNLTAGVINIPALANHTVARWIYSANQPDAGQGFTANPYTLAAYTYAAGPLPDYGFVTTFQPELLGGGQAAGDPIILWIGSGGGVFKAAQINWVSGGVEYAMLNITAAGVGFNGVAMEFRQVPGHSYAI